MLYDRGCLALHHLALDSQTYDVGDTPSWRVVCAICDRV